MKRISAMRLVLLLVLVCVLSGCATEREAEPVAGATVSGQLDEGEAGEKLLFEIQVDQEGDPVGIDFRGALVRGHIWLRLVGETGETYQEWGFEEAGPFMVTETLYPSAGMCRVILAWDGPVQLAQYQASWKAAPIEVPEVTGWALFPGIGMVLVGLGFAVYALLRRWKVDYLFLGALGWGVAVVLKFAWAVPVNHLIYDALTRSFSAGLAQGIFYVYVGALTGVFEVGVVWVVLRYTKLGAVGWKRAVAFGVGFGAVEALLLGVSSLVGAVVALKFPALLPLEALQQFVMVAHPLYGVAPIVERFFTIWIHLGASVLLFYGVWTRRARWFWIAFAYKTVVDAVAAFAQFWGIETLGHLWAIEAVVVVMGVVGWWGVHAIQVRYQEMRERGALTVE